MRTISSPRRNSPRSKRNEKGPKWIDLRHGPVAGAGHRRGALEDVAEAQEQLARLEGLGQVIVRADLQPRHPVGGIGTGGEHQDRHLRMLAQAAGIVEPGFARHHHVEDEGIEDEVLRLGPRLGRARRRRHPVAVLGQEAGQEIAQAAVVVHHENVRGMVGNVDACIHRASGFFVGPCLSGFVGPEYELLHMGAVVRDR